MHKKHLDWTPDLTRPAGKGGGTQHFDASDGEDRLQIETTDWGEGELSINGEVVAHVDDRESGSRAFRDLETVSEEIEAERHEAADTNESASDAGSGIP